MAEKGKRGFAGMDAEKQRQIASKGGKAAHQKGRAHEFTPEEAREAGRKARHGHQRTAALQPASQEAGRMGGGPEPGGQAPERPPERPLERLPEGQLQPPLAPPSPPAEAERSIPA
jgi:uncharacterized protein